MNMKLSTIVFLALLSFTSSCQKNNKYTAYLNTTDTLLKAIYNNDNLKVGSMIGVNPEKIGEDIEHFEFKMKQTTKLLQKYGLPDRTAYEVKEYPQESADLIDVIVAVNDEKSIQKAATKITIRFVKFLPPNKIAFFKVSGPFVEKSTIAPMSN